MPRNSAGLYTLPIGAFSSGGLIKSSDMNSNFSDIATALTGSLPVNGAAGMTGPFLAADGIQAAPGIAFLADRGTGFFRSGAGTFDWTTAGTIGGSFGAAGMTVVGALTVGGNANLNNLTLGGAFATTNLTVTGVLGSGTAGLSVALGYPLSSQNGGSPYYYTTAATGGIANAQTIASGTMLPFGYTWAGGQAIAVYPGFNNTSDLTLLPPNTLTASFTAHHVMKQVPGTSTGALATLTGGEVQSGSWAVVVDDGTYLQLINPQVPTPLAAVANLTLTRANHKTLIEVGANVTLTLPAPYPNGELMIVNLDSNTPFTLATPSGTIYGPIAATPGASIVVPARSGVAIYRAYSDGTNWFAGGLTQAGYQTPSVQYLTTPGAQYYYPSAGCTFARIRKCGAGAGSTGGGATSGQAPTSGGGTTTFGGWTAVGGGAPAGIGDASIGGMSLGGIGGTGGINGTGVVLQRIDGGDGGNTLGNLNTIVACWIGEGGRSFLGKAYPALTWTGPAAGTAAGAATGTGYGTGARGQVARGSGSSSYTAGGSGGGGEFVEFLVPYPATTSVIVGTGGPAGAGSLSGSPGRQGVVIVEEYFF